MVSDAQFSRQQERFHEPNGQVGSPALRILMVEEAADTAGNMAPLLRQWGFEVITVRSGPEALAAAQAASIP